MTTLNPTQQRELHTKLNIERLQRLSNNVESGDETARSIVEQLREIANELKQVNNL